MARSSSRCRKREHVDPPADREGARVRRSTREDLLAEDRLGVLPEDKCAANALRRKRFSRRAARCGCGTSIVDAFRQFGRHFRRQRAPLNRGMDDRDDARRHHAGHTQVCFQEESILSCLARKVFLTRIY